MACDHVLSGYPGCGKCLEARLAKTYHILGLYADDPKELQAHVLRLLDEERSR